MNGRISVLASPRFAVAVMAGLGAFAVFGAFGPNPESALFFSTWPFRLAVALLAAGLAVSLFSRMRDVGSMRVAGSVLLHASMVLLIVGGTYNTFASRVSTLELIEGQEVRVPETELVLRLERLHPFYRAGGWRKGDAAEVSLFDGEGLVRTATIHVNRPLVHEGVRFYMGEHGFAPQLSVRGSTPGRSFKGFVSLETEFESEVFYWREFSLPNTRLAATAVFRPSPDGPFLKHPRMKLVVRRDGRKVFAGELGPLEEASVGEYRISFDEVRYWAGLDMRRDPGLRVIFASFWLAVAGAAAALVPRIARG